MKRHVNDQSCFYSHINVGSKKLTTEEKERRQYVLSLKLIVATRVTVTGATKSCSKQWKHPRKNVHADWPKRHVYPPHDGVKHEHDVSSLPQQAKEAKKRAKLGWKDDGLVCACFVTIDCAL